MSILALPDFTLYTSSVQPSLLSARKKNQPPPFQSRRHGLSRSRPLPPPSPPTSLLPLTPTHLFPANQSIHSNPPKLASQTMFSRSLLASRTALAARSSSRRAFASSTGSGQPVTPSPKNEANANTPIIVSMVSLVEKMGESGRGEERKERRSEGAVVYSSLS